MKANQLATLILRLLGIYFIADTIPSISSAFYTVYNLAENDPFHGATNMAFGYVIFFVLRIVIGLLLLFFAASLSKKLAPMDSPEEQASPITSKQAQTLAFAVAGVLIFASALPQLFSSIFNLLRTTSDYDTPLNPSWVTNRRTIIESSIGTLLKTIFGIWLFFGADGFANFFGLLRNFGTPKPPPSQ